MAKIYANASELIGGTPLVAFDKLAAKCFIKVFDNIIRR